MNSRQSTKSVWLHYTTSGFYQCILWMLIINCWSMHISIYYNLSLYADIILLKVKETTWIAYVQWKWFFLFYLFYLVLQKYVRRHIQKLFIVERKVHCFEWLHDPTIYKTEFVFLIFWKRCLPVEVNFMCI